MERNLSTVTKEEWLMFAISLTGAFLYYSSMALAIYFSENQVLTAGIAVTTISLAALLSRLLLKNKNNQRSKIYTVVGISTMFVGLVLAVMTTSEMQPELLLIAAVAYLMLYISEQ